MEIKTTQKTEQDQTLAGATMPELSRSSIMGDVAAALRAEVLGTGSKFQGGLRFSTESEAVSDQAQPAVATRYGMSSATDPETVTEMGEGLRASMLRLRDSEVLAIASTRPREDSGVSTEYGAPAIPLFARITA